LLRWNGNIKPRDIAILNENGTGGRRGTAPVLGSGKFVFVNQIGLLYKVFVEDANQFWINTAIGATLSGTPDLVALSSQESKIIEVKTGQLSEENQLKDQAQLEIYRTCLQLY